MIEYFTDNEAESLLKELAAMELPLMQPGDITTAMYAEYIGVDYKKAKKTLLALVNDGTLISQEVRNPATGLKVRVFRRA